MVASLTATPRRAAQVAQCIARVASGSAATSAASAGWSTRPIFGDRPGLRFGAIESPGRQPRCQRDTELSLTPKRRATSARGTPASRARHTRSRRSTERVCTPPSGPRCQVFRKRL